jgi:hypothetical protein
MKLRRLQTHERRDHGSFGDFVCVNCRNFVSSEVLLSGVHHRNHCPYCLSSRHLDLFKAGDRLSACKARMRPVALTQKRTSKKYPGEQRGEIMLVHQCEGCGKISINRIASDDNAEILMEVFEISCGMKSIEEFIFAENNIHLLTPNDRPILQVQLFGRC